ncbi:MAG: SDR family oxidoreductase [Deltaproteobacteria bacterium]|nr:SDR family oxidoreductase [Deltaproteobacteria bacterium]
MKIKGKTVLVTGGAVRIGRAISEALAERGAKVAVHYWRSKVDSRFRGNDVRADLSKFSEIKRLVAAVEKKLGPIDILVNNAAIFNRKDFLKVTEKDWSDHLDLNLKAPFFLAQAVAKKMLHKKEGKIINIADFEALHPSKGYAPYCISKAGIMGLTKVLAKELAPYIQVNAVAPGAILPPKNYSAALKKKIAEKTLLKRWGSPEDIANAVCFLIEGGDYMTGETIFIEGGRLLT